MGKIRVKTLGDEKVEKKQVQEAKKRAEIKKTEKKQEEKQTVTNELNETKPAEKEIYAQPTEEVKTKKQKFAEKKTATRSAKYKNVASKVDKNKLYNLSEALVLLPQLKTTTFDESVELHINTIDKGISGSVILPHGTGKKTRVAIASEELIQEIEGGKISFDILLAESSMMPKLAKVAKILGPRGLMPNPKNGTITQNPEETRKKYESGQMNFKTEAKFPLLHLTVGKVSFGDKKLTENIQTTIEAVQIINIKNVTLKSTMSPGIRIDFTSL